MTFREILDQLILMLGQDAGGEFEAMAKREVNNVYAALLEESNADLEQRTFTVSVSSGQTEVGMPMGIQNVINIKDTTNSTDIKLISRQEYDASWLLQAATGQPLRAYPAKELGVKAQPTTAGVLTIESSSSADSGGNFNVAVRGLSSATPVYETVQLAGTTPQSTTNSYDTENGLERITLVPASGSSFSGLVTIKDVDGNTICEIAPHGELSTTYEWWGFDPQPSDTYSYTVRAEVRRPPLVNDGDWPEINSNFHSLLIHGPAVILAPALGQTEIAASANNTFRRNYKRFLGSHQRRPTQRRSFKPTTGPGAVVPVGRPLIKGIDYR